MDFNLPKIDFSEMTKGVRNVSSSVNSVIEATAREKKAAIDERERNKVFQEEKLRNDSEVIQLINKYKPHLFKNFILTILATAIGTAIIVYGIPPLIVFVKSLIQ